MNCCVLFVIITLFCVCYSQNENVCVVCACSEHSVDCSQRELKKIFHEADWSGVDVTQDLDIDFSGNPLQILTTVPDLPINKLNLSRCDLGEIRDGAFANLEELSSLDLSRNQLSTAAISRKIFSIQFTPDTLISDLQKLSFANLRYLSLAYNDIHALPKNIFMFMRDLQVLDLSGNPLSMIDQVTMAALSDVKLTELSLASCELETLPDGLLRRQRNLQKLDLSDNRFTTIPTVLSETVSLVSLNLDKNSLTNLTEGTALSSLTKLQELRICKQSRLQYINARALGGLESLKSLHITNNPRLNSIDPGFLVWEDDHDNEQTPFLEELYLNSNNISSISSEFLDHWHQLRRADFSNNPYVCDCSNQWMVDVLVPLLFKMDAGDNTANMICKRPNELRGLSFDTLMLTNRTLGCVEMEEFNASPGPDMAILLGIMIGIFVTFPIVLILVLLWKNGYFQRWRKVNVKPTEYDEDDAF
ncbi:leucine-rich repeat neuronal protein 3 [Amyelois transitella]|uniref:leucine-rich repeat neuronal protein 3 n=1 Tax=Amyelois transitella TaxID=680683 RepID=UPI00067D3B30|nr:leucine-rich repeat neuronal protein 3 [Amyelois transitella]